MGSKLLGLGAIAALFAGAAQAVTATDEEQIYLGVSGLYEIGASARDSDNGYGFHLNLGYPLSANTAVEGAFYSLQRDRDIDGKEDYQRGLHLNYVRDYGLYRWNAEQGFESYLPSFKPYWLAGIGAAQEDVRGDKHYHFGVDAGGGLLFPTRYSWSVRAEAVALLQVNDKSVPNDDVLVDYQFRIGVQFPLNLPLYRDAHVTPQPELAPQVVPVDSAVGAVTDLDLRGVKFHNDSALLTDDAKQILDGVAATLSNQPNLAIEIGGYTDAVGNDQYNQKLSQNRAESVRQYLIGKGVPASGLSAYGYGESNPIADNETAEGREANRRVEFRIK
jgi:outer membrane protein OmpA-like peptidoglycan-associated protein